jgi:phosphopantetheinyl transferase
VLAVDLRQRLLDHLDAGVILNIPLAVEPAELGELEALLSPLERNRSRRFVAPALGRRFTVARGRLRQVLGMVLGQRPQEVAIAVGDWGKPWVAAARALNIDFNLSHAAEWAMLGLRRGGMIGVDLEQDRDALDEAAVARECMHPEEYRAWSGLPTLHRRAALLRTWVFKEAILKALGVGAVHGFQWVRLPAAHWQASPRAWLQPYFDEEARVGSVVSAAAVAASCPPQAIHHEVKPWLAGLHVGALPAPTGYVAAVCATAVLEGLQQWAWPELSGKS